MLSYTFLAFPDVLHCHMQSIGTTDALGNGIIIAALGKATMGHNSRVLHGTDTIIPGDRERRTGAHSGTRTRTHMLHLVIPPPQTDGSTRRTQPCIRDRFKHASYCPGERP